jgi:hypothetical protein
MLMAATFGGSRLAGPPPALQMGGDYGSLALDSQQISAHGNLPFR